MEEQLSKLKSQIQKIEVLKTFKEWGPEYQLWESATEKLASELFGQEGLKLLKGQSTVTFSYIDSDYNNQQYLKELDNKKKILEGLFEELKEEKEILQPPKEKNILKEIWRKEQALKENLLKTEEAQELQSTLLQYLEKELSLDSIPGLRFRKLKSERRFQTWWSTEGTGYPIESPWGKIEPFLGILQQHEAEKTVKKRLESEGLFVESRSQGEDQHLIIGKKDGSSNKAHIIIDGKSIDIRTEDGRQEPTELVSRIETILTLHNGKKIRTTREILEETPE